MTLNTPLEFGGTVYNGNIYVSPKGTVTFGQGDYTFWDYPATPSISIASFDYHAFANGVMWGAENNLYVKYGSTSTSICVDWKVMLWGQSSGEPIYIRMIAYVDPETYTWTPTYQVSSNAPAGARYGVRYTQGGEVFPLEIQTITEPPAENPVIEPDPTPEPTPETSPEPEPSPVVPVEPTPEPSPSQPEPEPAPSQEPSPTPEPALPPVEPLPLEPDPSPAPEPPGQPALEPEPLPALPEEPSPLPEPLPKPIVTPVPNPEPTIEPTLPTPVVPVEPSIPTTTPEINMETVISDVDSIDPKSLTEEDLLILAKIVEEIFANYEPGSEEYQAALDVLMIIAQSDDLELPAELAAIPLLGDVAGVLLDVINSLGNVGSDMSPQVRETAEKIVVVAVVVTQIVAVTAIGAMASTSIRRP